MNRFFSKLDLRDIKISPEGSRFPPDADEQEAAVEDKSSDEAFESTADVVTIESELIATTWETSPYSNGHLEHAVTETLVVEEETYIHSDREIVSSVQVDALSVTVDEEGEVLKVSARSRPSAVAGAIAGVVRECGRAEVQAIGAGATNQAVKAVAIAREYLRETGIDAVCIPAFIDVTIENEDRTAIRLIIEPR